MQGRTSREVTATVKDDGVVTDIVWAFGMVPVGVAAGQIDRGLRYYVTTPDGPAYLQTYLLPTGMSAIWVPDAPNALLSLPEATA